MTKLSRTAAYAAAALSLAGCAHNPQGPQGLAQPGPAAAAPEAVAEAAAPPPAPAPQAAAPIHDPAARIARSESPARIGGLDLGPIHAPAARAPVHHVAQAPARPAAPAPVYEPPRRAQAPAPIHEAAPRVAQAPAPAPAPLYDLQTSAIPQRAPAPIHQVAAYQAPAYAPAAPESYIAAGPRRLGEMAPVRDREDGRSGPARSASAAVPGPRRYATPEGDLSAPGPNELRRTASLGPIPSGRSYGFDQGLGARLVEAARAQTRSPVRYDGAYVKISYPWGDVPGDTGVCTDVIVRAYRQLGFDFQQMMHEDMRQAFSYYPSAEIYGLKEPDPNIDHRRVVNMEAFLERHARSLTPTRNAQDYQPGDIVSWRISGTQPHIGIISDKRDDRTGTPYVIHNIGAGVKEENMLFLSPPLGHYRFAPSGGSGPIRTAGL